MYKQTSVLIALSRMGCWAQWLSGGIPHVFSHPSLTDLRAETQKSQKKQPTTPAAEGVLYKYLAALFCLTISNSIINKSHFLLFVLPLIASYCHPFPELWIFLIIYVSDSIKKRALGVQHSGHFVTSFRLLKNRHSGMECVHSAKEMEGCSLRRINHRKREKLKEWDIP